MIPTPVAVIRGGTSRGVFFRAEDLPSAPSERDARILRVFRGDAGVLADGLGGEHPVLRKTAVVSALPRADDGRPVLHYLFGQVNADLTALDRSVECGNIAAGVGLFGRLHGWCPAESAGECWLHLANTGRRILARWANATDHSGDVRLTFPDVAPPRAADVLANGQPAHVLSVGSADVRMSLVRGVNPYVFVSGDSLGLSEPAVQSVGAEAFSVLDAVEAYARTLWPDVRTPKFCVVAPGAEPGCVSARIVYVSERRLHQSFAVTGAATLALAAAIPGTVVWESLRAPRSSQGFAVRTPEGDLQLSWSLRDDGLPAEVALDRTCRLILQGSVY